MGTLLALPIHYVLAPQLPWLYLAVTMALFGLGIWACAVTGRALGIADHGGMVWDETVAYLLVLFFVPDGAWWMVAAFLLFRFFDIWKPPPIRYYDRTLKSGFGVMFDDLIAAAYTLLVLAGAQVLLNGIT